MVKKKAIPTTDAVEVLQRRYFDGKPEMEALLRKERSNLEVAAKISTLRINAGLSQRALARRVGTTASVICRLENAEYEGHSLGMLQRIAFALNKRLEIRFLPARQPRRRA
jgi:ribosome-binding protein aMBF1 (putative translation factor)